MNRRQLLSNASLLSIAASSAAVAQVGAPPMNTPAHLQSGPQSSFSTQPWIEGNRFTSSAYSLERVVFKSQGVDLVGNLFTQERGKRPAVLIVGPVAYVKEQSPIQYASRLAKEGLTVLVFDPRFHGESGGLPRRMESGSAKVQDLRAAIDYLTTRGDVDANAIHMLGICQGVNWAIDATLADARIKSLSIVAGHYLIPETAALYLGSPEATSRRIEKAALAQAKFDKTGEVDYIPIISSTDPDALLTAKPIVEFYTRWADRGPFWNFHGLWENRITAMSEAGIWGHRVDNSLNRLKTRTLMIHADRAASGPKIPRDLFEMIPTPDKKLVWLGGQNQMQFYEDPVTIDMVVPHLAEFMRRA